MVSFAAFAIFFAGYIAASTLLLFTIVRTLHGGPFGALTVANSTVAIDVLPSSRRTEGIGYYGLSNNLAMALAPTIGIYLYRYSHSFELLFWIALIVAVAGLAVDGTVKIRPRSLPIGRGSTGGKLQTPPLAPASPHRRYAPQLLPPRNCLEGRGGTEVRKYEGTKVRRYGVSLDRFFLTKGWLLGLNMVAFGFCFGVLSNYLAIYGKEQLGITGGTGTYFMLCSIGLILSRLQGGRALRQGRLTHNAAEGMVISLVGYTLFILVPTLLPLLNDGDGGSQFSSFHSSVFTSIAYYGSALLIGLGNGHMWPAFQNMIIGVAENNRRGTANSTILVSWDVGMGLGILLGGIVAEHFGYGAAFWTVAAVNAVGVATFFTATRRFFLQRRLSMDIK
jgi:MFS family permease